MGRSCHELQPLDKNERLNKGLDDVKAKDTVPTPTIAYDVIM